MCRLALFNKLGEKLIEEKYGIEKFLTLLEKSQGGHGNSITLSKDGKIIYCNKGVNYKIATIVKRLKNTDYDFAMFHTRIKSVGIIKDSNCHPFKSKDVVLSMNGTEQGFSGLANALGITDTEACLKTITKFDLDLYKTLSGLSSNFIGFKDGRIFATSPNTWKSYDITVNDDGAIVISSELPKEFKRYKPKEKPFVWKEGEKLNIEEVVVVPIVTNTTNTGSAYRYWWENYQKERERYCCPDCLEIISKDEIIEGCCPICGEEIKGKDKLSQYQHWVD